MRESKRRRGQCERVKGGVGVREQRKERVM